VPVFLSSVLIDRASDSRPLFDSYALPPRRRKGRRLLSRSGARAIAILVLWRGAALFEGGGGGGTGPRGGGGGGGRPRSAGSRSPRRPRRERNGAADTSRHGANVPPSAVTEPVKLELPRRPSPSHHPPLWEQEGLRVTRAGSGTGGGTARGPDGHGRRCRSCSGGSASDIFAATRGGRSCPPGARRDARGRHEVRFLGHGGRARHPDPGDASHQDSGYRASSPKR